MTRRRVLCAALGLAVAAAAGAGGKTWRDIEPIDVSALTALPPAARAQILDRNGVPLAVSYQNAFNTSDVRPLYAFPALLREAFVAAEDRRFFDHRGVDWRARLAALWQDARALHAVRGASTITEQVVRILHPRPRTFWSRWIEGFEAQALECSASKAQILEFYLNQVPYAAERRGVAQAARYYFDRDVTTLTPKEMLALAVLPRAPSAYDLYRHPGRIDGAIARLASAMELTAEARSEMRASKLALVKPALPVDAGQFVRYIRESEGYAPGKLLTTLDASLQQTVETLLAERLKALGPKGAHDGAVIVADHTTGEILAWAVAGADGQGIDAVRTPRQPGSAMKPLLYALALDSGWTPATVIEDAPITEEIHAGMHAFNNYSHTFYGQVTLREALGNSLNIPAIHTIDYVGVGRYLAKLHELGIRSLTESASFYNEGLALGDGEVTLLELAQAYAALAHQGVYRPLTAMLDTGAPRPSRRVYSAEAASLIGNILSDPWARRLEFGLGSVLSLPNQTAAKTGTSTDYHDAWAMGYNARYVAGVWIGNLDDRPMDGVTGSTGPALVLHSIFARLAQNSPAEALYLSPKLERRDICLRLNAEKSCTKRTEYFLPGTKVADAPPPAVQEPALMRPADGLFLAYDPRLPADKQAFEFVAQAVPQGRKVRWLLNDEVVATTDGGYYLWPVARGDYRLTLQVADAQGEMHPVDSVAFHVK